MIIGDFRSWEADRLLFSPKLILALDYIRTCSFEEMEDGVYTLDQEGGYLILKEAPLFPHAEMRMEHHERYIDIHYLISGTEKFGFARDSGMNKAIKVDPPVDDHVFFDEVEHEMDLLLTAGQFVLFMPSDIHRPWCIAVEGIVQVRKALLKIAI